MGEYMKGRKIKLIFTLWMMIGLSCGKGSKAKESSGANTDSITEPKIEITIDRASPRKESTGMIGKVKVTVGYGSPAVKGRLIWGGLVPYNELWRSGADEATWIEFSKPVKVDGQALPAGRYGFFSIPGPTSWTVIFNQVWDQWGPYEYDAAKDVLRMTVEPSAMPDIAERLDYLVEKDGVSLVWEKIQVKLKIEPETGL
jgi:hypothetical protein